jgi:hypothetical protein
MSEDIDIEPLHDGPFFTSLRAVDDAPIPEVLGSLAAMVGHSRRHLMEAHQPHSHAKKKNYCWTVKWGRTKPSFERYS